MRLRATLAAFAYPAAGLLAMLAIWYGLVARGIVPDYLLPDPIRVGRALIESMRDGTLFPHLGATLHATIVGYFAGSFIAFLLAALISEFKPAERFLYLHLVAIQAIPKVSIAPLVFLWAGFDLQGKTILVALVCSFPVFANALSGFRAADPNLIDLLRAAGGSRAHIFFTVKLPTAAGQLFSGLEVGVAFALIGCVVMEFIGSTRGMGFLIQDASNTYNLSLSFAAIIMLGLIGVVGNALVRALRRRVVFWEKRSGAEVAGAAAANG